MKHIHFLTLSLMLASFCVCQSSTPEDTFAYSAQARAEHQIISNMQKNLANLPFFIEEDKYCTLAAANFYQALQAAKTDAQANAIINDYSAIQATCFADQHRPERVRQREAIIKQMITENQQLLINSIKNRYQINDTDNN